MPHPLYALLRADVVEPEELLHVLSGHFQRAEGDSRGGWSFPARGDAHIHVRIKDDVVRDIEPGLNFDPEEAEQLAAMVRAALVDGQSTAIHTAVLFTGMPVEGWFRAPRDSFQILPAPPQAPRPPYLYADHPFLLQYPVVISSDLSLRAQRSAREAAQWTWLLNTFLMPGVSTIGPRSRNLWAISPDPKSAAPIPGSKWSQEFYSIPDWRWPDSLLNPNSAELLRIPSDAYYSQRGIRVGEALSIPDTLGDDVARFLDLSSVPRGRFLRAAQWKAAASEIWERHISSWYIALVAVIEGLAHIDEPVDLCPTCGRDRNQRPTQRFKDFLTRFAPGSGSRTELDVLYRVRSSLAHGGDILRHDSPMGAGMLRSGGLERQAMDRLSTAVTVAMLNWLRAQ